MVAVVIVIVVRFKQNGRNLQIKAKYLKTKVAAFINTLLIYYTFLKNNSYSVLSVSRLNCCYRRGIWQQKSTLQREAKLNFWSIWGTERTR